MTNREKYAEEILDIVCSGHTFAIRKDSGKITRCSGATCGLCLFYAENGACCEATIEWANAEYTEKPKISKKDRSFLSFIKDNHMYLARDIGGDLRLYYNAYPAKNEKILGASICPFDVDLPMIKQEDEEPWSIEDLKKLEVVEEYELCD